jgi:hypothetical protein
MLVVTCWHSGTSNLTSPPPPPSTNASNQLHHNHGVLILLSAASIVRLPPLQQKLLADSEQLLHRRRHHNSKRALTFGDGIIQRLLARLPNSSQDHAHHRAKAHLHAWPAQCESLPALVPDL